jgi:hypothetical protein
LKTVVASLLHSKNDPQASLGEAALVAHQLGPIDANAARQDSPGAHAGSQSRVYVVRVDPVGQGHLE